MIWLLLIKLSGETDRSRSTPGDGFLRSSESTEDGELWRSASSLLVLAASLREALGAAL